MLAKKADGSMLFKVEGIPEAAMVSELAGTGGLVSLKYSNQNHINDLSVICAFMRDLFWGLVCGL